MKYQNLIYSRAFKYRIDKVDDNISLLWSIEEKGKSLKARSGILLKEQYSNTYLLLDFNLYKNKPVLNTIIKDKYSQITEDIKLCIKTNNSIIIELNNAEKDYSNDSKTVIRYYLSKEIIDILRENIIQNLYFEDSKYFNRIQVKICVFNNKTEILTQYLRIYYNIIEDILNNDCDIPAKLEKTQIIQISENQTNKSKTSNNITKEEKENNESEECYVYVMHDLSNGYYKIGMSKSPHYREKTLQSEKPCIELLYAKKFPNRLLAHAIEFALHKTYSEKRLRGEWFILNEKDVIDIGKLLI